MKIDIQEINPKAEHVEQEIGFLCAFIKRRQISWHISVYSVCVCERFAYIALVNEQVEVHSFGSSLHVYDLSKQQQQHHRLEMIKTHIACKSHQPKLFQLFR